MTQAARTGARERAVASLRQRRLEAGDLPALRALHAHLHRASPLPGLFVRETDAFFARHVARDGQIIGMFDRGALVAYGVLGLPEADAPDHFGHDIGLDAAQRRRCAHLDGSGVHPDWRGLGLQKTLTRQRVALGQGAGRTLFLSTAALHNVASLGNLTACRLRVVALVRKYDAARLVLHRDMTAPPPARAPSGAGFDVVLDGGAAGHQSALQAGCVGVHVRRDGPVPVLHYTPKPADMR